MTHFCFYQGENPRLVERIRGACELHWGEVNQWHCDQFWLWMMPEAVEISFAETRNAIGAISGYVRTDGLGDRIGRSRDRWHNERFISTVINQANWPLSDDWTGTFAAVVYSKTDRRVVICNDLIGHIPIYFSLRSSGLVGSTSLILLGQSGDFQPDAVGVLQRTRVPRGNYGRRTVLKNVFESLVPDAVILPIDAEPRGIHLGG